MSAENCTDTTRCPCPCLPKVTLEQAVIDLVESIALQENALSHILCAESRKMDAAMKLDGLPDRPPKASRVRIEVSFTSGTAMRVRVTDLGFGDLYPTSGKTWEEVLTEAGGKSV